MRVCLRLWPHTCIVSLYMAAPSLITEHDDAANHAKSVCSSRYYAVTCARGLAAVMSYAIEIAGQVYQDDSRHHTT